MTVPAGPDPYVPHRGTADLTVRGYDLDLDYRPTTNTLTGRAVLQVEVLRPLTVVLLDLVGLGVDRVTVDGRRPVRVRQSGSRLLITLAAPQQPGARLSVEVRYSGHPGPQSGPWGEVGWEELTDGALVAGQPDGAPTWFPCVDLPSEKAVFRTTVRTDSAYLVVAHGVPGVPRRGGSRTAWTFVQDEPTAPYLATVQIGRYVEHHVPGPVLQRLVTTPRLLARARADTARQGEMLALFTRLFGPYPYAAPYTVVVTDDDLEIPLEACGLAVLGAQHVDGARGSERLVAHELAHQWFGNSVGVRAWQHVWLNEGPACYAEWLWSESSGGPTAQALAAQWHRRLQARPQDLVLSDPGPERAFDDRVYKRGALTLHALRRATGDENFFTLLRRWTTEHRHGTVTTDDLRDLAGPAHADLLRDWLDRPALPPLPR